MKKSELYKMIQYAVLNAEKMLVGSKLEALRELFSQEDMAKMVEEAQEKQEAVEG